jgi:ZIP family zinc transporter
MLTTGILAAIVLTTLAGLATGIGSLISYFIPEPDTRYLSISLGFATGVMIFVAFIANKYGSEHLTNIGIIVSIFVMMVGLMLFE